MEKVNHVVKSQEAGDHDTKGSASAKALPFQLKSSSLDDQLQNIGEALGLFQSKKISSEQFAKALRPKGASEGSSVVKMLNQLSESEQREVAVRMISGWGSKTLGGLNEGLVYKLTKILSPEPGIMDSLGLNSKAPLEAKALSKLQNARSLDYLLGSKSGELSNSQMNLARHLISKVSDTKKDTKGMVQGDYWEKLQGKSKYMNQRDVRSEFGEHTNYGKNHMNGGTCALTSLAMALSYLGIKIPDESTEKTDLPTPSNDVERLENIGRNIKNNFNREAPEHWAALANHLKANVTDIGSGAHTQAWWEKNVLEAHLRAGHAVMCSIQGGKSSHVIRIQGMDKAGVIVDDPFGNSMIQKGSQRDESTSINKSTNGAQSNATSYLKGKVDENGTAGSDHRWPWKNVTVHNFKWIKALSKM